MNGNTLCVVAPIILLVLWVALSVPRAGHDRRYDIELRDDAPLEASRGETWSQITARNAAAQDAIRAKQPRQKLLRGRYPGLLETPPVEVVDGELVDDVPQLGSGAPQLPSGESRAIAKSKWRGW